MSEIRQKIKIPNAKDVLRDVLVIYFITMLGGYVTTATGMTSIPYMFAVVNILLVLSGFSLAVYWTPVNTLTHLHFVGFLVWLLGAFDILLGVKLVDWLMSALLIYGLMLTALCMSRFLGHDDQKKR